MSLHPQSIPAVPKQTAEVAKRAFRRGNRYMLMRDQLGEIYQDTDFAHLFAVRGRPGEAPWRLALVLIFQFAEGLSDEQAAEAGPRDSLMDVKGQFAWRAGFHSVWREKMVQAQARIFLAAATSATFLALPRPTRRS